MGFIDDIKGYAIEVYKKYGVLPSITIGQAIHESRYGESGLARNAKNIFGIKGTGTAGSYEVPTKEFINGKETTVLAEFRAYNNWGESFDDYGKLLATSPRYKDVRGAENWKAGVEALGSSGYATDPAYAGKLANVIISNELYKIDQEVTGNTAPIYDPKYFGTTLREGDQGFFNLAPVGVTGVVSETFKSTVFLLSGILLLGFGVWFLFGGGGGMVVDVVTDAIKEE